jgi:hypothetical protein
VTAGERNVVGVTAPERQFQSSRNAAVNVMMVVLHHNPRRLVPVPRQSDGYLGVGPAEPRPVIKVDAARLDFAARNHGRSRQSEAPLGLERHLSHQRGQIRFDVAVVGAERVMRSATSRGTMTSG